MTGKISRRQSLYGLLSFAAGLAGLQKHALARTPAASEGPFYPLPAMRRGDTDNDLVTIAGQVREAGGDIFMLTGVIADKNGRPLPGLRIEIWQCDMNGIYMHPGDRRSGGHDTGFQGFGFDITDDAGRYRFRTIKPGKYPGRTPHIHVKIRDGNRDLLTTQFYVAGLPENNRDFLYRRMTPQQADSVSLVYTDTDNGPEAVVNLTL